MARFQVHLRFLSPSPLSKRSSVREAKVEVTGTECESGDDLVSSPLIPMVADGCGVDGEVRVESGTQFSLLATAAAALRRSLVLCSLGAGEEGTERPWTSDGRRKSSISLTSRSTGSMAFLVYRWSSCRKYQAKFPALVPVYLEFLLNLCNVPMIVEKQHTYYFTLYAKTPLCTWWPSEGIFRINAENGQELLVREQLNKGIVPHGVDLHCLAGLIKAWFRELPNGVLDSIAPEQVMHCNTEEECSQLASVLLLLKQLCSTGLLI
ncbi:hypothetical protein HPP92_021929 [Vanilla planifolia]|uniref:Rho-GAP domain-containing protein n=1 Tax=Vanilla planifolia TaxID=51239 RepID=A0A835UGS0_VANPL|nr:hypothetical protein HPP92_021929 [Vanilla planifolia]